MFNMTRRGYLKSACITLFLLFSTQYTFADETAINKDLQEAINKAQPINQGDFIYDIQKTDPLILAINIEELRKGYQKQQKNLTKNVGDKEMGIGDALITIIMPGGLLYAGFRKLELGEAKESLLAINSDINELSYDLTILNTQNNNQLLLAQLP